MGKMHPFITVSVEALQSQYDAANRRIIRANRAQLDNEYAEGVRDALAWIMGYGMLPFPNDEVEEHDT